jgi:hypothetical protein
MIGGLHEEDLEGLKAVVGNEVLEFSIPVPGKSRALSR